MSQDMTTPTDWLGAKRVASELGMSYQAVLGWAKREDDPLPVRCIAGNNKQWRVFRSDLNEWLMRNSTPAESRRGCT